MKHRFDIGDEVIVVQRGSGCAGQELNKIVKITEKGNYGQRNGYKVKPKIGNSFTSKFNGFIGENSFKLVKKDNSLPKKVQSFLNFE